MEQCLKKACKGKICQTCVKLLNKAFFNIFLPFFYFYGLLSAFFFGSYYYRFYYYLTFFTT